MRNFWLGRLLSPLSLVLAHTLLAAAADDACPLSASSPQLVLCCSPENDLYRALVAGGRAPLRKDAPKDAIHAAQNRSGVLLLADQYPHSGLQVDAELLQAAAEKKLRLFIEFPSSVAGVPLGEPRGVQWERTVVASRTFDLGLAESRILMMHDCRFRPAQAANPILVMARVAGYDMALYGLPAEQHPIVFQLPDGPLIATTKLSNFVTARYAPTHDWLTLWRHLLAALDPDGAPHPLVAKPTVYPAYGPHNTLPEDAESVALGRCAQWYKQSRLLLSPKRAAEVHRLLRLGDETTKMPPTADVHADGSHGILEGYASQIHRDGTQPQRIPIRADCQAEAAAALAMHGWIAGDDHSRQLATNLLDYLYFSSELHRGERGNPKHPAFGLIAWGAISPTWQIANYGDDNARALLATMLVAGSLQSSRWDVPMLKALFANLRTTGRYGFRGQRIDMAQLEQRGWKAFHDQETIYYSPFFEGYNWACYLWAYDKTERPEFLTKAKTGIRMTMDVYPEGWVWGDNLDRAHMLLPLAWLVRVEDTAEHRRWLTQVARDLLQHQQPCGAIPEMLSANASTHYVAPSSNDAYGTSETPLLQRNGDPVSDQLYTTGFALLGLREAVAATGDKTLKEAEDKLAEYVVRIQTRSEIHPYFDGTWFRAFDFRRWDYWSSSGDVGWGAWCVETGWGPAWNAIVLGLRERNSSLWDSTSRSEIRDALDEVELFMAENDGRPVN